MISLRVARPIPALKLVRETNITNIYNFNGGGRGGNHHGINGLQRDRAQTLLWSLAETAEQGLEAVVHVHVIGGGFREARRTNVATLFDALRETRHTGALNETCQPDQLPLWTAQARAHKDDIGSAPG